VYEKVTSFTIHYYSTTYSSTTVATYYVNGSTALELLELVLVACTYFPAVWWSGNGTSTMYCTCTVRDSGTETCLPIMHDIDNLTSHVELNCIARTYMYLYVVRSCTVTNFVLANILLVATVKRGLLLQCKWDTRLLLSQYYSY
jgi:hypothetical protein